MLTKILDEYTYCEFYYERKYLDYRLDWQPMPCNTRPSQVVTATINSALSREREPESDPVRLQQ